MIKKCIALLFLALLLLTAALYLSLQLTQVQEALFQYAVGEVKTRSGFSVAAEKVGLKFPLTLSLERLTVQDEEGNIAAAERAELTLSPLSLLSKKWGVPFWSLTQASFNGSSPLDLEGSLLYDSGNGEGKLRLYSSGLFLRLSLEKKGAKAKLESHGMQASGEIEGSIDEWLAGSPLRGFVKVQGDQWQVESPLSIKGNALTFEALKGSAFDLQVKGWAALDSTGWKEETKLLISSEEYPVQGVATLSGPLAAPSFTVKALLSGIGALSASGTLSKELLTAELVSSSIALRGIGLKEPLMKISLHNPLSPQRYGAAAFEAESVQFHEFALQAPRLSISKEAESPDWQAAAQGEEFNLFGSGHWDEKSAAFSIAGGHIGQGTLQGGLQYSDGLFELQLHGNKLPAPLLNALLPLKSKSGELTAALELTGGAEELSGSLKMELDRLLLSDALPQNLLKGSLEAQFQKKNLSITCELQTDEGNKILQLASTLPATLTLTAPLISIDRELPYQLRAKASMPVGPLLDLLATDASAIRGEAHLDISGDGTLNAPVVRGTLEIADGRYESYELGTLIQEIRAEIAAEGGKLQLTSFSGNDGSGGRLKGRGSWSLDKGNPFSLEITLDNFLLASLDTLLCRASGSIHLSGDRQSAKLAGSIKSEELSLPLPESKGPPLSHIAVSYINQQRNERSPTSAYPLRKKEYPIELEIDLAIPGNMEIVSEELSSQWKGALTVKGTVEEPSIEGALQLKEGRYILNGKALDLKEGTIAFKGDLKEDTTLFVVATREIQGYYVDIILKGAAKDPEIALRASPSLPQQEILSLVLFGRPPSEISERQDEMLEYSLSSLREYSKGGPGALGKLEKTLHIDTIDISRGSNDDLQVQLGKYLTPNVFISVNKGLADEGSKVAAEVKIQKNLSLQVEADDNAAGQISLKWRKDY